MKKIIAILIFAALAGCTKEETLPTVTMSAEGIGTFQLEYYAGSWQSETVYGYWTKEVVYRPGETLKLAVHTNDYGVTLWIGDEGKSVAPQAYYCFEVVNN